MNALHMNGPLEEANVHYLVVIFSNFLFLTQYNINHLIYEQSIKNTAGYTIITFDNWICKPNFIV